MSIFISYIIWMRMVFQCSSTVWKTSTADIYSFPLQASLKQRHKTEQRSFSWTTNKLAVPLHDLTQRHMFEFTCTVPVQLYFSSNSIILQYNNYNKRLMTAELFMLMILLLWVMNCFLFLFHLISLKLVVLLIGLLLQEN